VTECQIDVRQIAPGLYHYVSPFRVQTDRGREFFALRVQR